MSGDGKGIDITKLSIEQLQQLKKQHEEEIEGLSGNLGALRVAMNKFLDSQKTIETFAETPAGAEILVPLTSSMYVPGKVKTSEKLLVDVGTGFFIRKDADGAGAIFKKKVAMLKTNTDSLSQMIQQKQGNLRAITTELQNRVSQAAS
jgi:prefoldin alpha subunit